MNRYEDRGSEADIQTPGETVGFWVSFCVLCMLVALGLLPGAVAVWKWLW